MARRSLALGLLLLSTASFAEDDPVAIEAAARASFGACFRGSDEATVALAQSNRYLAYLVRYQGYDPARIAHANACALAYRPLPPLCPPDSPRFLAELKARDAALLAVVAAGSLPTLEPELGASPPREQCTDVAAYLR